MENRRSWKLKEAKDGEKEDVKEYHEEGKLGLSFGRRYYLVFCTVCQEFAEFFLTQNHHRGRKKRAFCVTIC